MNYDIHTPEPQPVPEPTVTLTLTRTEFALLRATQYYYLVATGALDVTTSLMRQMSEISADLDITFPCHDFNNPIKRFDGRIIGGEVVKHIGAEKVYPFQENL